LTLASGLGAVSSMALGASTLYVGSSNGEVQSMTKAGLSPAVLSLPTGSNVTGLVVASGYVWASNGNLVRCEEASCESTGFEQFKVTLTSIGAVAFAFDDTKMFAAPFDKVSGPSAIHVGPRVPVDGGFAQISA